MDYSYIRLGEFNESELGHNEHYFSTRYTFLDCRGTLKIAPTAEFGYGSRIITLSHQIVTGQFEPKTVIKPVVIEDYAWITSFAILYNCTICHHGIVGIGAVVTNMTVDPYTIVAGNPAKPVAKWNTELKKWQRIEW